MKNKKFIVWYRILLIANILTLVIGLLIAFASNSTVFDFYNQATSNFFNDGEPFSGSYLELKSWLFGIIGATMVGFNTLCLYILVFAFKKLQKWAWSAMLIGITSWFVIDSFISIQLGANYNVYWINIPAILSFYIPLLFTFKYFNVKQNNDEVDN